MKRLHNDFEAAANKYQAKLLSLSLSKTLKTGVCAVTHKNIKTKQSFHKILYLLVEKRSNFGAD
jgi:hypothetical protein